MPENRQTLSGYVVMRYYRAPEVVLNVVYDGKGLFTPAFSNPLFLVDVWSVGCILAELLLGKVLFPGKDHIDQWIKIVEVLGSPGHEFMHKLPETVQQFLRKFNYHAGVPLDKIFTDSVFPPMDEPQKKISIKAKPRKPICTPANGRDFLTKLLVIDPENRISVEEALRHPYVDEKHEAGELDAEPRPVLAAEPSKWRLVCVPLC